MREKTLSLELLFQKFLKLIFEKHGLLESQIHNIEQKKVETMQKMFARIKVIEDKISLKCDESINRSKSE